MALIVEDGTGVTDANTYAGIDDVRSYANERGVTLPSDELVEPMIHKGMDYLEGKGLGLLSLTFPPSVDGYLCGLTLTEGLTRLANALAQLCIEQHTHVELAPVRTDAFIIEETVGPITTKYSESYGMAAGSSPSLPAVSAILRPLLSNCGRESFRVVRV